MKNVVKNQTVTFTSKLSEFEIINSEFIKCKCYALASGNNVNGSNITVKSIDNAIARGEFYNKPVVAHLYKDEDSKWRVGGHDCKWVITNTNVEIVNECIPFGTIPESCNIRKETVLEPDGVTYNTYVVMDIILWTGRFNIMDAAYSDDIYFNQSCELIINKGHWQDDDIYAIDDFTFSALCLLNKSDDSKKNVRPCFPSCRVEKIQSYSFNQDSFRQEFTLMLDEYKKSQNKSQKQSIKEGVKQMNFTKFVETLSQIKINETENNKYKLLNVSDEKVFVLDLEDYKAYGFNYALTSDDGDETLVIDFDSKCEMSLSACEKITDEGFEEFSISEVISQEAEKKTEKSMEAFAKDFDNRIEEIQTQYNELNENYKAALEELSVFKNAESERKKQEHKNDVDAIVTEFSKKLAKVPEFLIYKARLDYSKSTDEIQKELTLMAGKSVMDNQTKSNFSYTPVSTTLSNNKRTNNAVNRYGDLLDKFMN